MFTLRGLRETACDLVSVMSRNRRFKTYTREASHEIKTVQLKPKMDKNPKRLFSTAFFPSLARARSSCLLVEDD